MNFSRILVANRGEIACRVLAAVRARGYRGIAVYSEADAGARHVQMADIAHCIGPAPVAESYLNIERVLAAARICGADALHPGYGFLSENADFARACDGAGLVFIGPSAEVIALMANKAEAKRRMLAAGVPCVPGYQGEQQDDATLLREAEQLGFPLMVKAAAGGGGRGMRLVTEPENLPQELTRARSEAQGAFGSDELILERALPSPRHVEIQVLADSAGNCIHLGERDCSVQRRHQKVLEESPSPAVSTELRETMGAAAVTAAQEIGYTGAGTVEYLLDASGAFYFLEMNTRLQVEHPVTELVTGLDLVALQLDIAAGQPLPLTQDMVHQNGWAIEARLYAEAPERGFLPQTGDVLVWQPAPTVRTDHGLLEGQQIGAFYDPMLAKVIAHGRDREDARNTLINALRQTRLLGTATNQSFLIRALEHPEFGAGNATTTFIDEHLAEATARAPVVGTRELALAAAVLVGTARHNSELPWHGWYSNDDARIPLRLAHRKDQWALQVQLWQRGEQMRVTVEEQACDLALVQFDKRSATVRIDDEEVRVDHARSGKRLFLCCAGENFWFDDQTLAPPKPPPEGSDGILRAPMAGRVIAVNTKVGEKVKVGAVLAVVEAMKMEHQVTAPVAGEVSAVETSPGDQVSNRQVLVRVSIPE